MGDELIYAADATIAALERARECDSPSPRLSEAAKGLAEAIKEWLNKPEGKDTPPSLGRMRDTLIDLSEDGAKC